jgi:hypothetical protein
MGWYFLWKRMIEFGLWLKRFYHFIRDGFVLRPFILAHQPVFLKDSLYVFFSRLQNDDVSEIIDAPRILQMRVNIARQIMVQNKMGTVEDQLQQNTGGGMVNFEPRINATDSCARANLKQVESDLFLSLFGFGAIPTQVYVNDSRNFEITLFNSGRHHSLNRTKVLVDEGDAPRFVLKIPEYGSRAFLEFELLASGFEVSGEVKQRCNIENNLLNYQWSCYFPNSGSQAYEIVVWMVKDDDKVFLKRIDRAVNVVRVDHLTQRQVWIWATMAGVISGIFSFIALLRQLGIW